VDGADNIQVYNSNDDPARTNFAVVREVPGSVDAITRIRAIHPNISSNAYGGYFLSRMLAPLGQLLGRFTGFFGELSGTANADSSGGAYETKASVTTTAQSFTKAITMSQDHIDVLSDQEIALLCRLKDALGTGLQIRFFYQFGADAAFYTEWKTLESHTVFLSRLTAFQTFKDIRRSIEEISLSLPAGSGITVQVIRSAGTGNVLMDYYQIVTKPTLRIFSTSTAAGTRTRYDSKQHDVVAVNSSDQMTTDLVALEGSDPFELAPNCENYIIYAPGDIRRELGEVVYDDTLSFDEIKVTPRWRIL
jgi:hypothetical protein